MSFWRLVQIVFFSISLLAIGLWVNDGTQVFTKDKSEKITQVQDEIFGTTVEKREWVEDFQLGLLPDDPLQPYRSLAFPLILSLLTILYSQKMIRKHANSESSS